MKYFFLCITLSLFVQGFSQKELLLRPYLGLQTGFWSNLTRPVKVDTRKNFIEVEGDVGLTLEYKVNKRFGYNAGIYAGLAATGYGFLLKTGCRQTGFATSWSGATYMRYGIGMDYVLSDKITKPDFNRKKATLVLSLSGGFSINDRAYEDLNAGSLGGFSSTDSCGNYATGVNTFAYNIKEVTASVWIRPWLKLYSKGKERVAFSFIFNHGLTNSYHEDVTYDYNGTLYKFTNATKGTTLGFNLSYPIVLKRWESSNQDHSPGNQQILKIK